MFLTGGRYEEERAKEYRKANKMVQKALKKAKKDYYQILSSLIIFPFSSCMHFKLLVTVFGESYDQ